jgi:hypothetical protein
LTVSGFPSPTTAGAPQTLSVTARNADGSIDPGYRDTVDFTSNDAQASLPDNYTFTAADAGTHTFAAALLTAGTHSITATDTANPNINGSQTGIVVTPAAADHLDVSGPAGGTAGQAFAVTVTARDRYDNVATGYRGMVHFSSSDSRATLPSDYAFTAADNGVHLFPGLTLVRAGSQTVTVASPTVLHAGGLIIIITPGGVVVINPAELPVTEAGTPFALTVTAQDAYGNVATGYRGTIHLTSSDSRAVLEGDHTFTAADNGVYAFGVSLLTAGTHSLTATDRANPNLTGTVGGIVVTPAATDHFDVAGPAGGTAGQAFAVTVTARDRYGNVATGYTRTVHFTTSDPQASLPPDYTFTATDQGAHRFDGVTLFTAGSQILTAQDTLMVSVGGSIIIIIIHYVPTHIWLVDYPAVQAGDPYVLTTVVQDAYRNTITDYGGTLHFTSSDPRAVLPADYTFTAADRGVHAFGMILETTGTQSVTATDTVNPDLTGTRSGILVTPAPAVALSLAAPPTTHPGEPFVLTVTAVDPFGNTDTNYAGTVTFTSSDAAATLPDNYAFQPADGGVASFGAVLQTPGNQTITATDTSSGITGGATVTVTPDGGFPDTPGRSAARAGGTRGAVARPDAAILFWGIRATAGTAGTSSPGWPTGATVTSPGTPARAVPASPDREGTPLFSAAANGEGQGLASARCGAPRGARAAPAEALAAVFDNQDGGLCYGAVVDALARTRTS